MPFEKFAQRNPKDWAANAHLFKQEGGNGGWGGFGQPGAREIIRRDEAQEIRADDDRGARVVILNITLTLCAFLGILLIGPLAAVLAIPGAIILIAAIIYPRKENENLQIDLMRLNNAQVAVISGAIILCAFWFLMVGQYWWLRIVDWYPFRVLLPWWIVCPVEAVILSAWYGFRDLREAHRRSLYNRNWPPTFQQMPADVGPYYAGEYPLGEGYSDDEIRAMLEDALNANNAPRVIPAPVPVYSKDSPNPNGNGHKPPLFTNAQQAEPAQDDVFKSPGGMTIKWADFAEFILKGVNVGISTPKWTWRWKNKEYIKEMQSSARVLNIAKYDGKGSENILLLSTGLEAITELERIHTRLNAAKRDAQYPPTPLSQPSGAENEPTSEGRKVEGRKEG